jgi:lipid-binding SYLF domain-containing protein
MDGRVGVAVGYAEEAEWSREMNARSDTLSRRAVVAAMAAAPILPTVAHAASPPEEAEADAALQRLLSENEAARKISAQSKAVLIFPKVTKAGLGIGGLHGKGVLREGGRTVADYRITAASFGLQAGAQTFSYVLFFVTDKALDHLHNSKGWSIGSGPSVVVLDEGKAKAVNTTTLRDDVYAFISGQSGLMAGLGLEGTKISKVKDAR